jgi:hypothetical protein
MDLPGSGRHGRTRRFLSYHVNKDATNTWHFCEVSLCGLLLERLIEDAMSEHESRRAVARPFQRRGPLPVAQNATAILQHHLKARGFAQVEMVTRWGEIVGSNLANHCFPYKLSTGSSGGATLTLLADDRAALELQHQSPKLIDKINSYFGSCVISRIKVVAGDLPNPLPQTPVLRRLSAPEEAEVQQWTAGVEDPALRDALTRLGRNAMAESRKTAILKR